MTPAKVRGREEDEERGEDDERGGERGLLPRGLRVDVALVRVGDQVELAVDDVLDRVERLEPREDLGATRPLKKVRGFRHSISVPSSSHRLELSQTRVLHTRVSESVSDPETVVHGMLK